MPSNPECLQLVCLCAAWCRLCEGYGANFDEAARALRGRWPHLRTDWLDVEDEAALVGDLDIETFPTVLVLRNGLVLFAGPVTPQPATLVRVAAAALARAGSPSQADVQFASVARALHVRALEPERG